MRISLVIPFYNLSAYAGTTLASVVSALDALCGDRGEVEVVCIDDGSTDDTGKLLDVAAGRTPGIRVIHKPNGGEGSARNAGIEATTGEYLMFLDGDDVLLPNALTTAVRLVRAHQEADIIGMRYAVFADGGEIPAAADGAVTTSYDTRHRVPAGLLCKQGVFPTLFRRSTLADLRFSDLPLGADREYVMAALARANVVVVSDAVVEGYRVREGSMARARWSVRKVKSLNDHAVRGIAALAASGKRLDPAGIGYVAALVISEVPARLARLGNEDGTHDLWRHWVKSVAELPADVLPPSVCAVRRLILLVGWNRPLSVGVAWICRALNVA